MIAMSMAGDTRNVIIEKIFLANRMAPLAIQKDEKNPNCYKVLFKFEESISDNFIFFETRLLTENSLDVSYIESRSIYIDNLKKNEEKMKAFKAIMKDFSENKFYMGDFNFNIENINYKINGFKQMFGKNNTVVYEHVEIYIPRYMFIIISLYMDDFLNPFNEMEKEFLFISNDILNMRFEKVENVKLVASSKYEDGDVFHYPTMYEMYCGKTVWKFIYDIITEDDLELKELLKYSIFEPEYSQYNEKLIGIVEDRDYTYIITTNAQDKIVSLKVSKDLIDKTNLLDPYFIFDLPPEDNGEEDELINTDDNQEE